ncbi:MAG: L,D-transpeptidase family protein [Hahellaceae bacterium]|nr:L,D-transpeptidase family protein [Hahellaceae bacterium]
MGKYVFAVTRNAWVSAAAGLVLSIAAQAEVSGMQLAMKERSSMAAQSKAATLPSIDRVLVRKKERVMFLLSNEAPVRAYRIALGDEPIGHKRYEGDERTPEGIYTLDWRNPNSDYHKSIHVSYPNEADHEYASTSGFSPGGMIMIHGWPNKRSPKWTLDRLLNTDWTDGCIAVSDSAMDEIWELVHDGITIEIQP